MAPENAVKKINNLLVSTTDPGYQDGRTCEASYKSFDKAIEKMKVKRLVWSLDNVNIVHFIFLLLL